MTEQVTGPRLPLLRDISFVYLLTGLVAALGLLTSVAGLVYGQRGLYDAGAPTFSAFLGQDAITLIFGLPLLTVSAWLARRGSTRALLCWMGALFYVAYSYFFYVAGVRFNLLFPGYIALVSMGMYGALALLCAVDLPALKARFDPRTPVRLTGGFLIGISLFFAGLWFTLIISNLQADRELDAVARAVIAVDGVVLLPLLFFGGLWIWQRQPLGYALAGLLLVKALATLLTLVVNTLVATRWGQASNPVQSLACLGGMAAAMAMLVSYLRCVGDGGALSQDLALPKRECSQRAG